MVRSLLSACLVLALVGSARAQEPDATLDAAKKVHADALAKARATLVESLAAACKAAMTSGNLDALKMLQAEKETFESVGKLPASPRMKIATTAYQTSVRGAYAALEKTYEQTVRDLTKAGKLAEAEAVQEEYKEFRGTSAGGLRPAEVATKDDLQRYLGGTSWAWGENHKFKPNGHVENAGWDALGLVTKWQAVDRRTVVLFLEKGRDRDRYAILTFAEDLSEFTGHDFLYPAKIPVAKRK